MLALAAGCAKQHAVCCPAPCGRTVECSLPLVERGQIRSAADAEQLRFAVEATPWMPPQYHALTACECQCLAVTQSSIGNQLDAERQSIEQGWCPKEWQQARLLDDVLATAAAEARNKSAAAALTLFYSLAEAEAKHDLLSRSLTEIEGLLLKIEQLRAQGLQVTVDEGELRQRHLDVQTARSEVDVVLLRLNHELRGLLGFESTPLHVRFWPAAELKVVAYPLNPELEVQRGLSNRPELGLLRRARGAITPATLQVIHTMLGRVDSLLGSASNLSTGPVRQLADSLLGSPREVAQRRTQMSNQLQQRESDLAGEIRTTVSTLVERERQILLAQEKVASLAGSIERFEAERTIGERTFADVALARLRWYDAQGELVGRIVAFKSTQVRLEELQGLLVAECGKYLHCDGSCPHRVPLGAGAMEVLPSEEPPAEEVPPSALPPADAAPAEGLPATEAAGPDGPALAPPPAARDAPHLISVEPAASIQPASALTPVTLPRLDPAPAMASPSAWWEAASAVGGTLRR